MTDEHLDVLWKRLSSATNIDHLGYGEAVTIGSVFGEMKAEIIKQRDALEKIEMVTKYDDEANEIAHEALK